MEFSREGYRFVVESSKQKKNIQKIRINQLATPTLQRKGTYIALFIPTLVESLLMDGYQYRTQSNIFFRNRDIKQAIQGPGRLPPYFRV